MPGALPRYGAGMREASGDASARGWGRAIVAVMLVVAAWLGGVGSAQALPGDPPIESLSPADGAVLAPNPDGVVITFTCPEYAFADAGGGLRLFGGREYYSLRVTTSPQLDADGRLASAFTVDQATASSDPARPAGECFSAFSDGSASGVHTKPGTYYWQVARICSACGGYEVGPVRTLRIAVQASPTVTLRWKPWAGYGVVADVQASGVPDGSAVTIQRQAAGAWVDAASGSIAGARQRSISPCPGGATALRAVLVVGDQRIEGAQASVNVLKPAPSGRRPARTTAAGVGRPHRRRPSPSPCAARDVRSVFSPARSRRSARRPCPASSSRSSRCSRSRAHASRRMAASSPPCPTASSACGSPVG